MEALFEKWLIETEKISESSTEKYVRSIRAVSKDMITEGVITQSLYKVKSYDTYCGLMNRIFENKFFIDKNERGNRMYSSAMKKYEKFLRAFCGK